MLTNNSMLPEHMKIDLSKITNLRLNSTTNMLKRYAQKQALTIQIPKLLQTRTETIVSYPKSKKSQIGKKNLQLIVFFLLT